MSIKTLLIINDKPKTRLTASSFHHFTFHSRLRGYISGPVFIKNLNAKSIAPSDKIRRKFLEMS